VVTSQESAEWSRGVASLASFPFVQYRASLALLLSARTG